jgi:hypothetical protein
MNPGLIVSGVSLMLFGVLAALSARVNPTGNPTHPIGCLGGLAALGVVVGLVMALAGGAG